LRTNNYGFYYHFLGAQTWYLHLHKKKKDIGGINMKKVLVLTISLAMVLGTFTGCGTSSTAKHLLILKK